MRVLIWNPPWSSLGDPLHYRNCLKSHLIPQANLLSSAGFAVELALPVLMASERSLIDPAIRIIGLPQTFAQELTGSTVDPSPALYANPEGEMTSRIGNGLRKILASKYDVILLWETPVPFLEELYPDALIIHQMPGAFSRPPYPHTVTFDPVGLYKQGCLFKSHNEVTSFAAGAEEERLANSFAALVRSSISNLQPFDRQRICGGRRFSKLVLLPLQVSAHYAFRCDTGYETQMDFLLDVLSSERADTGVIVTQYRTPRVADMALNQDVSAALVSAWPNLIYSDEVDRLPAVSQYLLQLVDSVITCSSSIGFQALAWPRELIVRQPTFMAPYATDMASQSDIPWPETTRRTLAFLMNRHQPLAASVTEDRQFLVHLIEEIVSRKRQGKRGPDLLPSFHDLDPGYGERLLQSFRVERAAKDTGRVSERQAARQSELNKFNRAILNTKIKTISFDVFDTLVQRPTETPADVYKSLEAEALQITDGLAEDFARVRETLEVETRKASARGEITLDEIYDAIRRHYRLDEEITRNLKEAELALEYRLSAARPLGKKMWQAALDSGKPLYVISDMYLPEYAVAAILEKNGFRGYRELFVSSAHGVRKKEGALFDLVISSKKLAPETVIHIGDNKLSDIEQAKARGMEAFCIVRPIDRMRESRLYKPLYLSGKGRAGKMRSMITGLTAQTLFDAPAGPHEKTSHFQGSPFNLGYSALGPMLVAHMAWLVRQVERDQITQLFFLSREGWLLREVYLRLQRGNPTAIPSSYLYASRRAARVANLRSKGDVLALAGQPFRQGVALADLLESRFGLKIDEADEAVVARHRYAACREKLVSDNAGRVQFSSLCGHLSDRILANAQAERSAYLAYLSEVGIQNERRPAVVDIGWRANIQGALGSLIGRPLHGYYYATLEGAESWLASGHRVWAFAAEMATDAHPSAAVAHRHLLEFLTCHVEPSLQRFERRGNALSPVFCAEEGVAARRILIEQVHQGALQFAEDIMTALGGNVDDALIDCFTAERVFASFAAEPHPVDAAMLLDQHFEDSLGGVARQYIISPSASGSRNDSVWPPGADAIYSVENASRSDDRSVKLQNTVVSAQSQSPNGQAAAFVSSLPGRIYPVLQGAEALVVEALVNERKLRKYRRGRAEFFQESRHAMARAWYRATARAQEGNGKEL
jgi:HAD superfamily hydrolase (TIGR01549 family)